MKIWVIIDDIYWLYIMKRLSTQNHEYHIYIDNHNSFYGDKKRDHNIQNIITWIQYLQNIWVQKIILPPAYELAFLQDDRYKSQFENLICNIYTSYLQNYVSKYSTVGKLWFVWDLADMEFLDIYISEIFSDFKASVHQSQNKYFKYPFLIYKKITPLRKYNLQHISPDNHIINHIVKTDIRKLKSYNIDTIIPLNYSYFALWKFFDRNVKKIKFHNLFSKTDIIKNIWSQESEYSCDIYFTGDDTLFLSQKKREYILSRWKTTNLSKTLI